MLSPAISHRSPDAGPQCANGLDSVQSDSGGHRELLAYAFARWGAAHLGALQPKPRITAAVVDAANAAAGGCRRVTAGGGYWHSPRAPPRRHRRCLITRRPPSRCSFAASEIGGDSRRQSFVCCSARTMKDARAAYQRVPDRWTPAYA